MFPAGALQIEEFARSVVHSSTSNMLLAQQAELKKLTAEVGALKGERETFFLFRLCEQATYIIRAQDTVTALLQVQTIEGVGQLGGLKEL